MNKYIVRKLRNPESIEITALGNSPYSSCYVMFNFAKDEIELKGDNKLLSTIKTKANCIEELKFDKQACKLLFEKIVSYFRASDNFPSLWRFDTLKEAEDFARCFGNYQNPEWGRGIIVEKSLVDGYYYMGEPELF